MIDCEKWLQPDGSLYCLSPWVNFPSADDPKQVQLDGRFELAELEFIIERMKSMK